MRPAVCLAAVLVLAAGCGGTKTVTRTVTVDSSAKQGVGAPLEHVEFGYIKSLEQKGAGYELKFDPAWFLSGETANKAAAEDGAVPPGEPVPNDNYVVDEGHRLLTYRVAPDARVTVLVDGPEERADHGRGAGPDRGREPQAALGADRDRLLDPLPHRHGAARSTSSTGPRRRRRPGARRSGPRARSRPPRPAS